MATQAYRITEGQVKGILELLTVMINASPENRDDLIMLRTYLTSALRGDPIEEPQDSPMWWQWIKEHPVPKPISKPGDWPYPDWSRPTCKTVIKPAGMTEEEATKKAEDKK